QHAPDRVDDALDPVERDAGAVEHPASRAEIVLHVDDNDGGLVYVDRERLRSRVDGQHRDERTLGPGGVLRTRAGTVEEPLEGSRELPLPPLDMKAPPPRG